MTNWPRGWAELGGVGKKAGVQAAVAVQAGHRGIASVIIDVPGDHDLPIGQRHHLVDVVQGVVPAHQHRLKGGIQGAVRVQPGQAGAGVTLALAEIPAQQDLAVGLDRDTPDDAVHPAFEGGIQAAVGVDPGKAAAVFAAHPVEVAADDDLAVALGRQGIDHAGPAGHGGDVGKVAIDGCRWHSGRRCRPGDWPL